MPKTATLPSIRVEPELRAELEAVLGEGESLSEFVEASIREAIEYRKVQMDFHARGEKAWLRYQASGRGSTTETVLGRLQTKLDARRKKLAR
jgi:hypothetical protein